MKGCVCDDSFELLTWQTFNWAELEVSDDAQTNDRPGFIKSTRYHTYICLLIHNLNYILHFLFHCAPSLYLSHRHTHKVHFLSPSKWKVHPYFFFSILNEGASSKEKKIATKASRLLTHINSVALVQPHEYTYTLPTDMKLFLCWHFPQKVKNTEPVLPHLEDQNLCWKYFHSPKDIIFSRKVRISRPRYRMFHILAGGLSLHCGEGRVQPPHQKFSCELSNSKHSEGRVAPHSSQRGGELVCLVNDETTLFGALIFFLIFICLWLP